MFIAFEPSSAQADNQLTITSNLTWTVDGSADGKSVVKNGGRENKYGALVGSPESDTITHVNAVTGKTDYEYILRNGVLYYREAVYNDDGNFVRCESGTMTRLFRFCSLRTRI